MGLNEPLKSPKSTESPVPKHRCASLNATEMSVSVFLAHKPGTMKPEKSVCYGTK